MLSLKNVGSICCLLILFSGCSKQQATIETPKIDLGVEQVDFNPGNAPTVEFDVPGMVCEHMCVPKVRKTLKEQAGVVDVQVDLKTKIVVVAIDEDLFDANGAVEALLAADFSDSALRTGGPVLIAPAEKAIEEPVPSTEDSVGEET